MTTDLRQKAAAAIAAAAGDAELALVNVMREREEFARTLMRVLSEADSKRGLTAKTAEQAEDLLARTAVHP